ncbi:MAG: WbqC family protein, partial [Prevotella sp.]|nr:WbqC family protein [Prevotella sp.]
CSMFNVQSLKDFRTAIQPKHPQPDADFIPKPYYQVYQQKNGFIPNLSILDLLFNMGNEAILYL